MLNPFDIVRDFEQALCEYTGAPYAVAVNSCTMALLLAVKYYIENYKVSYWPPNREWELLIPKRTYVSVPQRIIHAGGKVCFSDEDWVGSYQLFPAPIWDSARYFTSGLYKGEIKGSAEKFKMYRDCAGQFVCCSFHATKILGDTQGGAILHDNPEADKWFRKARFDGRTEGVHPKDDVFDMLGYHCYLSPDVAARLLHKLTVLPKHNDPLPNDDYPDLSKFEVFNG